MTPSPSTPSMSLTIVNTDTLLPLGEAAARVEELAATEQPDLLDEVRIQAEARALYERRQENEDRARHFAMLRLLAEAGLGILSFSNPDVVPRPGKRAEWRALGAALERGKLLEECSELPTKDLSTGTVVYRLRNRGWTSVPAQALGSARRGASFTWLKARELARAQGIAFDSLPSDAAEIRRREAARARTSRRATQRQIALERVERAKMRETGARIAKHQGPRVDRAYALLRRTLQAMHDAQPELDRDERELLGEAIDQLYYVEDFVLAALGLRQDPRDAWKYR